MPVLRHRGRYYSGPLPDPLTRRPGLAGGNAGTAVGTTSQPARRSSVTSDSVEDTGLRSRLRSVRLDARILVKRPGIRTSPLSTTIFTGSGVGYGSWRRRPRSLALVRLRLRRCGLT